MNSKKILTSLSILLVLLSSDLYAGKLQSVYVDQNEDLKTCRIAEIGWGGIENPLFLEGEVYWVEGRGCSVIIPETTFYKHWDFCALSEVSTMGATSITCGVSTVGGSSIEFSEFGGNAPVSCEFTCLTK